jgi:hypothetical protein
VDVIGECNWGDGCGKLSKKFCKNKKIENRKNR